MARTKRTKAGTRDRASAMLQRYNKQAGYPTADQAWNVAMKSGGSASVCDLAAGGYAVPVERSTKIAPPSRTEPILAHIPSGIVPILPTPVHGLWAIVGPAQKR